MTERPAAPPCRATARCDQTLDREPAGQQWCRRHYRHARQMIADLDVALGLLTDTDVDALTPRVNPTGRRGKGDAPPAPINLTASALIDDRTIYVPRRQPDADTANPVDVLTFWCAQITERIGVRPAGRGAGALLAYLARNLSAASRLADCDWLYEDLGAVLHQLQHATSDKPARPLGRCPQLEREHPDADLAECGGPIWPVWPDNPLDPPGAECASCRRTWTGLDLIRLRLILDQQRKEKTS